MSDNHSSTALVPTHRAARYGKQLCSHLGRRADANWDDEAGSGEIRFGGGAAECTLEATAEGLALTLDAPADDFDRLEDVVGRHLVRFGARDELVCAWTRQGGGRGTTQRNDAAQG